MCLDLSDSGAVLTPVPSHAKGIVPPVCRHGVLFGEWDRSYRPLLSSRAVGPRAGDSGVT